ncbi:hypothetical protein CLM62_30615 [Streptomyces sp. SA15]|uniref:hypothetical protein n=1 Tax=Streptomyces sp. SA15 TaxID=934019 RepID=UPI000BAEB73C|nr:hypothetical protein [Streptomyces sp. SA15]PAZ12317.1 hypothetical protein CLM62_30615 [Streptomyces sp. SA15]
MSETHLLYSYAITKMTKGQRKALLAGVDAGGRLPDGVVSARVLGSIPETWARTDQETGSRFLTLEGRAALIPIDRYRHLRRANPETGAVYGLNHYEGMGMSRDGLVIFQSRDGRIAEASESWRTLAGAYITERGRKLVGMPLTAPPLTARLPVGSRAVWVREGKPDSPCR